MMSQYQVLISPSSHIAALLADDQASVSIFSDRDVAVPIPVHRFVQAYPDFSVVSVATNEDAKKELDRRVENSQCLDMMLFCLTRACLLSFGGRSPMNSNCS